MLGVLGMYGELIQSNNDASANSSNILGSVNQTASSLNVPVPGFNIITGVVALGWLNGILFAPVIIGLIYIVIELVRGSESA